MVLYQRTWCFPFILLQHDFNTNNDQHLNNNNSGDQKETSISLKIFFYFLATRHNINNDRKETPSLNDVCPPYLWTMQKSGIDYFICLAVILYTLQKIEGGEVRFSQMCC